MALFACVFNIESRTFTKGHDYVLSASAGIVHYYLLLLLLDPHAYVLSASSTLHIEAT
jgi:hypothetical protein